MTVYNPPGQFAGFATAEDADDPIGEGSFYAWSPEEIKKLLPGDFAQRIIKYWDLKIYYGVQTKEPVSDWIICIFNFT